MFAPTRTLLHTYNCHDHDHDHDHDDDDDHHHHHHHRHHRHIVTSSHHDCHHHIKICHPYEQYVDWGKNIDFIFIRDENSPPPMNNMLIGVITSTLPS